jgi:hypothetical protein
VARSQTAAELARLREKVPDSVWWKNGGKLPSSLPSGNQALNLINNKLGTNYANLEQAKSDLELPLMFAGRQQWVNNLSGGSLPPWLQNVSMQSIAHEPEAWNLFMGALQQGRFDEGALAEWRKLVPGWAPSVRDDLAKQGVPFGMELLKSPGVNLTGEGPLWEGDYPTSMFQLHGFQQGEGDFYRTLSAEELMRSIWPIYNAQFNRPAGSAAPFESGLTFGSPQLMQGGDGRWAYSRSPVMGYNENNIVDPDLVKLAGFAGKSVPASDLYTQLAGGLYNRYNAHLQSQYAPAWNQFRSKLGLGEEDFWSLPEYAPFRDLPPDVLARIMAVLNGPLGPGGDSAGM